MNNDDPRKEYWNEKYLEYWKSRVDEAGDGKSEIIKGDSNTEGDDVYEKIFAEFGFNNGNLLEVGCAWGRMFPIYLMYDLDIYAVDISKAMIDEAKKNWSENKKIIELKESPAERLPFGDSSFDNLACLATLDATYQNQAISEFLRVTKPGAKIYFTGKNDNYFTNDDEAYKAEVGARNKKHPNYFTDTKKLIMILEKQGHSIEKVYCFPRRGDFGKFNYTTNIDERFYEYMLVLTRGDTYEDLPIISSEYSKTYSEIEKK